MECEHGEPHGHCGRMRGHHHWHHRHLPIRGPLHLLILKLLEEKPLHGSEIREVLESRLGLDIPSSAIYAILSILEDKGMVVSRWETAERGAARKLYSITEYGLEYLREGVEELKRFRKILEFLTS
ncbi:MAG: helix-turn-helix transcriptional regulator [Sulfolobales archaeon]|nr:PadR family transcriptional regulator [Sulfolobales archaeon]MCX8209196.1 PadR family transcriptional regulator [Sulfolobales archaeon]MDW8010056.1 helix-turn-helix transcriptional regulator [Sulfolobales archaeon]